MSTRDSNATNPPTSELDFPLFFGDWLKRRRKELDLTQNELADLASCSVFALRKIEAGERRPSKQLARLFVKALNLPNEAEATFIKVARGELSVEKLLYLSASSQPDRKSGVIPGNLPRTLTPFVGREPELNALAQLLGDSQCSLLTIVGPGGIGKTRLATETAHHSTTLFPDGVWFVPLASLDSLDQIVPAITYAVGFKFQEPVNLEAQLIHYLRYKKALIVLDNAEHLLEGASVCTDLLDECRQIKLLVTSRERLNLLSEWVFEIQGLPVPPDDQVKQFDAYSSVALFMQSARRVQADFNLSKEDRWWVIKICQITGGMPLAIELSAAWVGLLPIPEIATEIEHNLDFLSVSMRDLPERHRSLRATLDHSWKLLTDEEKLILSRLSVFRGVFHRTAAEEICGASLPVLSSLRNKSLLYRVDQNYYALHELIHQYAGLKLAERPEEKDRIAERHALYFVQYLADCEESLHGSRQVVIFDEMAMIIDDLSQGWLYMVTHSRSGAGRSGPFQARLLHSALFSLSLFYEMRCRSLEALNIIKQSIEYLNEVQSEFAQSDDASSFNSILGHLVAYLGLHQIYMQRYELARTHLDEAIRRLGEEHSRIERAQAMVMLAAVAHICGEYQFSAELLRQSREIFQQADNRWWYALSCTNLAATMYSLGKYQESKTLYEEASRLVMPGDLRLGIPLTTGFAYLLFLQGDYAGAEKMLQDALPLCDQLRSISITANILYYLGRVAFATHRLALAKSYYHKCIEINLELGDTHNLAIVQLHLGNCYVAGGDRIAARDQFAQAIKIGQEINQFNLVYYALVFLARMYLTENLTERARDIILVLRRCPIEYQMIIDDFASLQAQLQAALPGGQLDAMAEPVGGNVSLDEARAAVLAYVHEHENSW